MNALSAQHKQSFGKVAVLMGGTSAERAVSLVSGKAVLDALLAVGVDACGLDTADDGIMQTLASDGYEHAFIALHGRGGEDGVIQGALEMLGIPYTGSGVAGSALAMDKLLTKQVWQSAGIPTPDFSLLTTESDVEAARQQMAFPVIIKPANEGSSIGISKVETADELLPAWRAAVPYDKHVIAEQWVTGAEYTAAVLDGEVLPLIRLETPNTFYDYAAKYELDTTRYHIPCGLDASREAELGRLSLAAFDAVRASGWGRVDFMLDEAGQPWFIEVNTVPGLTDHSLVPKAASAAGLDYPRLICRILETSQQAVTGEAQHVRT